MSMTTWGSFVGSLLGGYGKCVVGLTFYLDIIMWQSQVENEHYSTVSRLIQLVICFIGITPYFLCPFMNTTCTVNFRATATGSL